MPGSLAHGLHRIRHLAVGALAFRVDPQRHLAAVRSGNGERSGKGGKDGNGES